jgi:hypothetical protein
MTKVTGPVGSNGGQWYQDPTTGRKFLLKPAQSADHAQNEAAIAAAYRAAGIDVPNLSTVSDGKGKSFIVSEFLASSPWNGQQSEAKKGMGIDMLTSNWDAFGAGGQNIVVDVNGAVYRIDYGGGGKYRATGPVKPEFDATQPWKDPSTMITGAFGQQMYGNVTNEDIANAMESIADLDLTEVEKQMIDAGVTDAALRKQILDVFAVRQKEAAKLRDDFRKYDPAATPLTGTGKQIAPGGKIATGTSTARKRKGVKKKSTINPSSRARPTRSRAITTVTKLVESNRNGSIFGDSDTDPVVDAAAVSALAKVAAARRAPGGLTTEKMMEHAYDMHGFSDPPVLATPQEIEKLIDQGWTVLVRGVGTYDNGVDPTNPKQTKNQKQVWGYLAGRRFISGAGTNGNQNMYGPGDYFATPHDAKYSWDNFHSKTPMLNGLENNSSMLVLVPPAGRIIKTTDLDTMRFQWTSTFQQINAINNPKYGSNPNATVAQIRKTLPQAALDNPIAKVYLGLLEAKEKARGNAAKQEADDAITAFSAYVGGHASFTALLLGYDGVEHAGSSGVTTFFNRSGMVALGEATNLTKISNLIKKTQRGKTDPKLRM